MASVSTYLLFDGNAEEAFEFYKSVFGTEYEGGILRYADHSPPEGVSLSDDQKQKIVNVALPILAGHVLMASDILPGMGFTPTPGNNFQITLQPDTRAEADRLHAALSTGGTPKEPMAEAFWGDYYGSLTDKFGIQWNINTSAKS